MAERKSALRRAPPRPELERLLALAKSVVMTEAEIQEQRASFIFGNAPASSGITKASATKATQGVRLTKHP